MEAYAKQVEQYESDCPIYQSIAEQKSKNAKIEEECSAFVKQLN